MATQSYIGDSRPSEERPTEALLHTQSTSNAVPGVQGEQAPASRKRRNHRAGKKKKARRQSFAVPEDDEGNEHRDRPGLDLRGQPHSTAARPPFYRLGQSGSRNLSETSLDSSALLDHR